MRPAVLGLTCEARLIRRETLSGIVGQSVHHGTTDVHHWRSSSRSEIDVLTERERQLLKRLAAEGKATRLLDEELATAKALEADGFLFLVGLTAVVTPRGQTPARR